MHTPSSFIKNARIVYTLIAASILLGASIALLRPLITAHPVETFCRISILSHRLGGEIYASASPPGMRGVKVQREVGIGFSDGQMIPCIVSPYPYPHITNIDGADLSVFDVGFSSTDRMAFACALSIVSFVLIWVAICT